MTNQFNLEKAMLRRELGESVLNRVDDLVRVSVGSLADADGILSYFSGAIEADVAGNVNGYDRIMDDWSKVNAAAIIGAIINNVAQDLNLVYGPETIIELRRGVFGDKGGCVPHGSVWNSRAVMMFAGEQTRIGTQVEDFIVWLVIRTARMISLSDGIATKGGVKK